MTRPFATHEQQIMGSIATADLLQAVDTPLQDGTMNWNSLAPMASLMSAGDVLVQYDQAYERYDTPIPQQVAAQLASTPPGLSDPVSYGTPVPNVSLVPHFDEATLGLPANSGWPAPLVSYTVDDPRPIVRTESTVDPLVVAGDASGLVNASSVGLLQGNPTILYSGTLDTHPGTEETDPLPPGQPGRDRHQSQAGLPVELAQRERRLHRDGFSTPGHLGSADVAHRLVPRRSGGHPDHRDLHR